MENRLHRQLLDLLTEGSLLEFQAIWSGLDEKSRRAQLAHVDEEWGTSLFSSALSALDEHTAPLVKFLIEQGAADPPFMPKEAWNKVSSRINPDINATLEPDFAAALNGIWDALVERGIGREDLANRHWGPQHIACQMSHHDETLAIERLRKMQSSGFDLDQKDEIGETPLLVAAWSASPRVMEYLLDKGASIHSVTSGGRDLLDFVFRDKGDDSKRRRMDEVAQCLNLIDARGFDVVSAFEKADRKAMEIWELDFMPVLADFQASKISEGTPVISPKEGRKSPRL